MYGKIALSLVFVLVFVSISLLGTLVSYTPGLVSRNNQASLGTTGDLTTDTWGIFDVHTGEILAGNNVTTAVPIASIAKLFTAYAVLESEKKDTVMTVTWSDISTEGRSGKLYAGKQATPRELLFPLLIESSNDAGVAIKRTLGAEFDASVSALTSELALTSTHIEDATGLSATDMSAVTDLAKFYVALRRDHPHIADITQLKMYISDETGFINNNPARTLPNFTGGKHGYTSEAGRTFVGTFRSDDGTGEIGIVLLGSADLKGDILRSLTYVEAHPVLALCYLGMECPLMKVVTKEITDSFQ